MTHFIYNIRRSVATNRRRSKIVKFRRENLNVNDVVNFMECTKQSMNYCSFNEITEILRGLLAQNKESYLTFKCKWDDLQVVTTITGQRTHEN